MEPRYRGRPGDAFVFAADATTLICVVNSPRRSTVGLTGLGLVVGAVVGWVAGLLRAPRT
jgi:hypothetical protein